MTAGQDHAQGGQGTIAVLLPRREVFAAAGAGAVSICVRNICSASAYRDRTVVLGEPVQTPFEDLTYRPVPPARWLPGSRTSRYLAGAVRLLRRLNPAVVEVHNRPQYIKPLRRRLPGVALLLYQHNDPRDTKGMASPAARRRLLDRVQAVVCVSEYIRSCMLDGLQDYAGRDKVHVSLNGIDTRRFAAPPDQERQRTVAFVGRVIPDKGALLFAQAVRAALPALPEWRAVLVGSHWFGSSSRMTDFEREVMGHIQALGSQGEITGYLPHDQVMARLQQAQIAVVPSLWDDPCPLTAIEAMASGCALITTARGGLPEVMDDAGWVLKAPTAEALADAIRTLATDADRRSAYQRAARSRAEQVLDIRAVSARLDRIREALL
ncbi:MAG: glycosyltransferase family 4 protein [Gammaproteobacteria bacterium]